MAKRIDGKEISSAMLDKVALEVAALKEKHIEPCLAVILVGDNPASQVYVRNKQRACERVGIRSVSHILPAETTQAALLDLIDTLNRDETVHGILCQLPLPEHLDSEQVLLAIAPEKMWMHFIPSMSAKSQSAMRICCPARPRA